MSALHACQKKIMILTFAYFLVKVVSRYITTIHRILISCITLDDLEHYVVQTNATAATLLHQYFTSISIPKSLQVS